MLASDTQVISDYLKYIIVNKYSLDETTIQEHFADTRDTLCYATNDNQSAVYNLIETKADLAIVVGGYNSSNTSHLVELCEEKLPTFFIDSADKILSEKEILITLSTTASGQLAPLVIKIVTGNSSGKYFTVCTSCFV